MLVNAELYVKDLPGQLVGSLEPISLVDGNILGVVHDREQIINDRICLNVTFNVNSADDLDCLKDIWKRKDIIISRIGSVVDTYTVEYMLVGKITATYIEELLDKAAKEIGFESVDVRYSSKTAGDGKRTAMISAKVIEEESVEKLDNFFLNACEESAITYIRGL